MQARENVSMQKLQAREHDHVSARARKAIEHASMSST